MSDAVNEQRHWTVWIRSKEPTFCGSSDDIPKECKRDDDLRRRRQMFVPGSYVLEAHAVSL